MKYVPGQGNPSAKLMLVGEAPGPTEERDGIPFSGASGHVVNDCLWKAGEQVLGSGMSRSEVYVTNVVKIRPPNNEIFRLPELHTKIEDFLPQLWKEIEEINPNCILAIGNTALKALTGETGIKNFRGSILPNCRSVLPKVVGTMHPASLMHGANESGGMMSFRDLTFIQFDFNRAVKQSLFREYNPPPRTLHIARNSAEFLRFWDRNVARGFRKVSVDIETSKAIPMCIGFAFSRYEAMSVPLLNIETPTNPDGWPLHDMTFAWKLIADILLDPQYQIIGQNFKFDQGRLDDILLPTTWPWFDTSLAWHTIYSELPKKLAFIASVITEEPYYKDELEEYNPKKDKLDKRLRYNARDCAVTYEVYEEELKILQELGLEDYFFNQMMPRHKFYYNLERRGFSRDIVQQKRLIKKYERYTRIIHNQNTRDLGYELNVNSNGPKNQVATCLFGDLKCPVRKDTGEETLEMLMLNAVKDDRRRRIINNILKERKSRKTLGTYVKAKASQDGKFHTTYNICGTETNRTSTSKPKPPVVAEPEGLAFQTLTKHGDVGADLRVMFIPSPSKILIEGDLSACQARIVAHLAGDEDALALMDRKDFKRNKFGIKDDIHTWTTILVTSMDFEAIDEEIRQLGKKTRHAGNFGMSKRRLSMMAKISEWKAGQCLIKFHEANPKIKGVFWEEIQQALADNGMVLVAPSGARRQFFDRWGDDMFKEAYAHLPQVIEADHRSAAGIRIEARAPWIEFIVEAHDSFTAEIPSGDKYIIEASEIIREELQVPIDFSKCSLPRGPLVIPCDVQVGYKNWKNMEKIKIQ